MIHGTFDNYKIWITLKLTTKQYNSPWMDGLLNKTAAKQSTKLLLTIFTTPINKLKIAKQTRKRTLRKLSQQIFAFVSLKCKRILWVLLPHPPNRSWNMLNWHIVSVKILMNDSNYSATHCSNSKLSNYQIYSYSPLISQGSG